MMDDEHEQAVLSGRIKRTDTESSIESDCTEDTTWKIKFQKLYLKYRDLSHQKVCFRVPVALVSSREVCSFTGSPHRAMPKICFR